jgi:hypothetical protein
VLPFFLEFIYNLKHLLLALSICEPTLKFQVNLPTQNFRTPDETEDQD